MTEEQIRGLPPDLFTLGSHTVTHPNLELSEKDRIQKELTESKQKLEKITGREIHLLSIPYGAYDERVIKLACQAGYKRVYSSVHKIEKNKTYVIKRIHVTPTDWPFEFRLKVLGAYRWLPWAIALKRKLITFRALLK